MENSAVEGGSQTAQRVRIDLAYEGTNYSGWAAQPGLRTVQSELEAALAVLLRAAETSAIRVTVAGRTDAGVHARGQVAHLDVTAAQLATWTGKLATHPDPEVRATARARKLNGVLKRRSAGDGDLTVWRVTEVAPDFDARFSAVWRRYEYRVAVGECDPLVRRFTARVNRDIDFDTLRRVSRELEGLRDFSTFCKAREGSTAIRHLTEFSWQRDTTGVFVARIQADAFCHSMVRALVGAVIAAASGRITPERLRELTAAKQRSSELPVMPAHGLSLEEIGYPEEQEWAARAARTRARRSEEDLADTNSAPSPTGAAPPER